MCAPSLLPRAPQLSPAFVLQGVQAPQQLPPAVLMMLFIYCLLATHAGLQRDQNEFDPAPKTRSWIGQGKQEVPGNTKQSELPPEVPFDPSHGILRALGTARASSPRWPPRSPMTMVMGMAQVQVPYHESDGQGAAALSPTWGDYLLTDDDPILVGVKGEKTKRRGFWKRPRFSRSGLPANSPADGFGDSYWRLRRFLKSQDIVSNVFPRWLGCSIPICIADIYTFAPCFSFFAYKHFVEQNQAFSSCANFNLISDRLVR